MLYAKISTAKTVTFGPVLAADGTMSNGALAYTDAKIFKNGTDGALDASATFTHKYEGVYALALTANDLNAVGCYEVVLNKNPLSAAPVKITVLAANVYDWMFGTSAPAVVGSAMLLTSGTGTGQISLSSGLVALQADQAVNTTKIAGVTQPAPGAAGGIAIDPLGVITGTFVAVTDTTAELSTGTGPAMLGGMIYVTSGTGSPMLRTITSTNGSVTIGVLNWGPTNPTPGDSFKVVYGRHPRLDGANRVDVGRIYGQDTFASAAVTFPATVASTTNITSASGVTLAAAQTFNMTGNITGNLSGSVGSVTGNVGGNVVGSVGSVTGMTTWTGARSVTITVTDGSNPLQSATVRVTQGVTTHSPTLTNASGEATFSLDDGTYTVSITKGGYAFTPSTITVAAGSVTFTKAMTATSATVPGAGQCTGVLTLVDPLGAVESGVVVTFRAKKPPNGSTAGYGYDNTETTSTSNAQGVVSRLFPLGAWYEWKRGTGPWQTFQTSSTEGASFNIASNVGTP